MINKALLVIDVQKHFFVEVPRLHEAALVEACAKCAALARRSNIPVFYIQTVYKADKSDWPAVWRDDPSWCANFIEGRSGAMLAEGLDVHQDDLIVTKKRFSSFFETNLDDLLRGRGVGHLILTGFAADVCVRQTGMDAYNRGYRLTLIEDAVEPQKETKKDALAYLEWLTDAKTISLNDFEKNLFPDTE